MSKSNVIHVNFGKGGGRIELSSIAKRQAMQFYQRGAMLDENKESYGAAEVAYKKAIELDPTLALAHTNLGNIYYRTNREELASESYAKALEYDPEQSEALYNLGIMNADKGMLHDAVELFYQAANFDPSFADAHWHLASAYQRIMDQLLHQQMAEAMGGMSSNVPFYEIDPQLAGLREHNAAVPGEHVEALKSAAGAHWRWFLSICPTGSDAENARSALIRLGFDPPGPKTPGPKRARRGPSGRGR